MIYHIIKPGETIKLIANKYNLTENEIIRINPHFRSWENIAPGAKINLPNIPQYIHEELDNIEPFIEDYYPTIDIDKIKHKEAEKTQVENVIERPKMKKLTYNNHYYSYYYPYNIYSNFPRKKRK